MPSSSASVFIADATLTHKHFCFCLRAALAPQIHTFVSHTETLRSIASTDASERAATMGRVCAFVDRAIGDVFRRHAQDEMAFPSFDVRDLSLFSAPLSVSILFTWPFISSLCRATVLPLSHVHHSVFGFVFFSIHCVIATG